MFYFTRRTLSATTNDIVAAFKVLGLRYSPHLAPPSRDEVRRQYRELARLHHPDLSSGDDQRMQVINTAYELIQSSNVLDATPTASSTKPSEDGGDTSRFKKKAGTRRQRVPEDFASGDDLSWTMKSTLDWEAFVGPSSGITEQEMKNPANHPFSHSKFFSFQEDTTIYHMIRGGATVTQVGRTLGKPATFIERRLHNAQFKLRVQYILKQEKQQSKRTQQDHARAGSKLYDARQDAENDIHAAPPKYPNMTESALRGPPTQSFFHSSFHDPTETQRKREWQPTFPEAQTPRYEVDMSLEELGEKDGLLRGRGKARTPNVSYKGHASKVSHSYENYKRLKGTKRK